MYPAQIETGKYANRKPRLICLAIHFEHLKRKKYTDSETLTHVVVMIERISLNGNHNLKAKQQKRIFIIGSYYLEYSRFNNVNGISVDSN